MNAIAVFAIVALVAAGCGGAGSDADPLADFNISNSEVVIYSALTVITKGEPGPNLTAANEEIYPATLDFIDAIREGRDEVGDDKAFRELVEVTESVEGWCEECSALLQREVDTFDD